MNLPPEVHRESTAAGAAAAPAPELSVIIPVLNEVENVAALNGRVVAELERLGRPFEIIWVNDGSTDGTGDAIRALAQSDRRVKLLELSRNYGQTAATMAGIDHARGEILLGMDGDGQNDPADIPLLLAKLGEGYDVVSGWRQRREDRLLSRRLPSIVANKLISLVSGVKLHDYGCSLKAYRRDVLKGVKLYGEMHRFVPIYAVWQGGRLAELPVRHHPRVAGRSKYGLGRALKVVLDLLVVQFLHKYLTKPIYVFGGFGVLSILAGLGFVILALVQKFTLGISLIQTPLPLISVMCVMIGAVSILMGLLAEMVVRVYFEAQTKDVYRVRGRLNLD
jgi:glycosyltransferase involved in cell wall biosynthesis